MIKDISIFLKLACVLVNAPALFAVPIDPNPIVVEGSVSFSGLSTDQALITQESAKAIVDYEKFDVLSGDIVRFAQPNESAVILNRVTGNETSFIDGSILANGQVFFVNPAGVTFGENSFVRADLFLAAAGNISDEDFLGGVKSFDLGGDVKNFGDIGSNAGSYLIGQSVLNHGNVKSEKGVSILASGDEILLKNQGSNLVLSLDQNSNSFSKEGIGINNLGTVEGEEVMFSAGDAFSDAIYHQGKIISKNSTKLHSDGGNIKVSGEVSSSNESSGGRIEIGGTDQGGVGAPRALNVSILDSAFIDASAKGVGDGGDVVIWSDNHTEMFGSILATGEVGGFAEVSGNTYDLGAIMRVNLGQGGKFLLDPLDVIIDDDLAQTIVNQLNGGVNVTISTQAATASSPSVTGEANTTNGDITVKSDIRVPASSNFAKLSLIADGDIVVEASDSADSIRIQNLQTGSSNGGDVFYFEAKENITIDGIIDNFGGGDGDVVLKSTGPVTSGSSTIKGNININAKIDANKGGFVIDGYDVILKNQTTSLLAGGADVTNNKVQITADNELKFDDGRLELFGDTDVLINAQKFNNLTGSNVFAVNAASADSVQWSIALPKLYDDNSNAIHTFGGLKSNNNAEYNSTISTATNGNISISTLSTTKNQYHFGISPAISITANNDSKIYGDIADSAFEGISIATADLIDANTFGGVFTQDTENSSIDQSGLVLTSVDGADDDKNVSSTGYNITPSGLQSSNGYSFNYTEGKLTVSRREITLTASDQSKTYGDAHTLDNTLANGAFSIADKGDAQDSTLPNGEVITDVSINSATGKNVSTDANVQTYADEIEILSPVVGTDGVGDGFRESNYDITYVPGDLTINRLDLVVIIDDQKRFAGQYFEIDQGAFSLKENLPDNQSLGMINISSLSGAVTDPSREKGFYPNEIVADRVISAMNNFDSDNYNITFIPGDLEILPYPGLLAILSEFHPGQSRVADRKFTFRDDISNVISISDSILYRVMEYTDWFSIPESDRDLIIEKLNQANLKEQSDDLLKYYLGVEYASPF